MKMKPFYLAFLLPSWLLADGLCAYRENPTVALNPCDCEMCCEPKPCTPSNVKDKRVKDKKECCEPIALPCEQPCEKCPDPNAITPVFSPLDRQLSVSLYGDFLYWVAKDSDMSYAIKATATGVNSTTTAFAPKRVKNNKVSWDPGFRVGIDLFFGSDGWSLGANWTHFKNETRSNIHVTGLALSTDASVPIGQEALINPYAYNVFFFTDDIPLAFQTMRNQWKLHFDQIDLVFARKFWLSQALVLEPFMGLRGARIHNRNNIKGETTITANATTYDVTDRTFFENEFWGVGGLVGIEPTWQMTCNFGLFGNASVGLLYGSYENKRKEKLQRSSGGTTESVNLPKSKDRFTSLQPSLDLQLGLRFEGGGCWAHFAIEVGAEAHAWFDLFNRYYLLDTRDDSPGVGDVNLITFQNMISETTNLYMAGGFARLKLDF